MTGKLRGEKPMINIDEVARLIKLFQEILNRYSIHNPDAKFHIEEFEANPCVCSMGKVFVLDGYLRFAPAKAQPPARPYKKVRKLLAPETVGLIGISGSKITPAGVILENLLASGRSTKDISIVHPKEQEIQGCKCQPSLDELKESLSGNKIDLFVVGVPASGPPGRTAEDVLSYIITNNISESVLIVSAGFDETRHGTEKTQRLRNLFGESRSYPDNGPVANGPNTLGNVFYSTDTRFTPKHKSGATGLGARNAALVCQSGAFMISRLSNLAGAVNPAIAISIGNQMDLTFSDYLNFLIDERDISVYGVYVEGFKDGDGAEFNKVVQRIVPGGRPLVVYKAGKTPEGIDAAKGHTASIAGDYVIAHKLMSNAGAYIAETFDEFQEIIKLFAMLSDTVVKTDGRIPKVAALSNAGFEKCAIGDNLYVDGVQLMAIAEYTEKTQNELKSIFVENGLSNIIDIGKILDLTPMANDKVYLKIVETIVSDDNVDCALISIVPETGMLQTLNSHNEDFSAEGTIATHLIDIKKRIKKPIAVCIESGHLYNPMVSYLEENNIPTFRSISIAARRLSRCMDYRVNNSIIE
jgi:acyl-CoA synthetase (NDP forming)